MKSKVIYGLGGLHTYTHTHTRIHSRMKVIIRNRPVAGAPGLKSCIVPCEASSFTTVLIITTTAYCDMNTDGGGWIVILRNKKSSSVSFNRNRTDYEKGFGILTTEFWYGLSAMHCLTQRGQWEMRVDYQYSNKTWSYLHYNQFSIGNASKKYPLTVKGFTGVGTDWYNYAWPLQNNGMKFSTPDQDNDRWGRGH